MGVVDENLGLLQNIESVVIACYRQDRTLQDRNIIKIYEAFIQHQRQLVRGRTPRPPENLSDIEQEIFDVMQEVMKVRRELTPPSKKPKRLLDKTNTFEDTLLACFRKVHNSANFWNEERGKQGYLKYVDNFIP